MTNRLLQYRVDNGAEQQFEIVGELVTIGRSAQSAITLNAKSVEQDHCRIVRHDGAWVVEDRGSQIGTYVVGTQGSHPQLCLPCQPLGDSDRVLIGPASKPILVAWLSPLAKSNDPIPTRKDAVEVGSLNTREPRTDDGAQSAAGQSIQPSSITVDEAVARQREFMEIQRQCDKEIAHVRRQYEVLCREHEERQVVLQKQVNGLEADTQRLKADIKRHKEDALGSARMHSAALENAVYQHKEEQRRLIKAGNEARLLAAERAVVIEEQQGKLQCLEHQIRELQAELRNCRAGLPHS